jgi:hypothetical protein
MVLAALVVTVTASAALLGAAGDIRLRMQFDDRLMQADDLLDAVDGPIRHWLRTASPSIVLPAGAAQPAVEILHDRLAETGEPVVVRIQGFDQCGMVPIALARSGSPIRLALAPDVLAALDQLESSPEDQPGLDWFIAASAERREGPAVFPDADGSIALGGAIATHNPGLINVNTAPIPLVETAIRASGTGGLEPIIAARLQRKPAPAPAPGPQRPADPQNPRIRLASSSPAWGFRIDIQVGPLRRSWWAVYVLVRSRWECMQRLAAGE